MKMIVEIDPIEEKDYAQIVANISDISYGIFEIRWNFRKHFERLIDAEQFKNQYDLLDRMMDELNELFPNVDTQ